MYFVIDRFEGNFAVCENYDTGKFVNIDKNKLPSDSKEGDFLLFENDEYIIDVKKTDERKKYIENKLKSVFK